MDKFSLPTPDQRLQILRTEMATPIEIIRGCIDLIVRHFEKNGTVPEEIASCVDGIVKAAESLKELHDDIH